MSLGPMTGEIENMEILKIILSLGGAVFEKLISFLWDW